jgi:NADP-dependent 3-hydroxy acid dehydrogenase YdfG
MGKCIAITGAGAGLGRALARSFACDGHTVLILGRTRTSLVAVAAELGPACQSIVCDVLGSFDELIHNSGWFLRTPA